MKEVRGAVKGISSIQCFFAHLMIFQGVGFRTYFCSEQTAEVESSRLPPKLLEPTNTAGPSTTILIDREVDIFPTRNRIASYLYLRSSNNHHHFRVASTRNVPVGIHTANHPALHNELKYSTPHILTKRIPTFQRR